MNIKFPYRVVGATTSILMVLALVGCKTKDMRLRPEVLPELPSDREMYSSPLPPISRSKDCSSVAILVMKTSGAYSEVMEKTLDTTLVEKLSALEAFTLAERSNIDAFRVDDLILGLEDADSVLPADNLVTAKITIIGSGRNVDIRSDERKVQQDANAKAQGMFDREGDPNLNTKQSFFGGFTDWFSVSATVDFRFYEKATRRTLLTKSYTYDFNKILDGSLQSWFIDSARDAANRFAGELGRHFAPIARVLQTRGGGRVARISIGANYGLYPGQEIYFYEIMDNSDIVADASFDRSAIGRGLVIETAARSAWVEVFDFTRVNVRRGVYADITPDYQTQGGARMEVR